MNTQLSKSKLLLLGTLITLGISYWLCQFAMLDLHGMRQFPTMLGVITLIILISSHCLKKNILSIVSILGYLGGFFVALLFSTDGVDAGGVRTNNLWIIWAATLFLCILLGIIFEIAIKLKKQTANANTSEKG